MILVFGKTGQVARELARKAPGLHFLGREDADLASPRQCNAAILALRPRAVINAAAYTAVDKAEGDAKLAIKVNAEAPARMAESCRRLSIPFLHLSTDYVFDGSGSTPFAPGAKASPVNAYGRSKLAGEEKVRASGCEHIILRTSWVFSAHGTNFVKTMLRLSETRTKLDIVSDQVGGPTPAAAIAEACLNAVGKLQKNPKLTGTYHFSGAPEVSWADFAREIFSAVGRAVVVDDISSTKYPTPAQRPLNSRLDCRGLEVFNLKRPDWIAGLGDILRELGLEQ